MRKYQNFALLLCALFLYLHNEAQQQPLNQINILSFSVKSKLPADVSVWSLIPGGMVLTAQRIPQSVTQGIKLVTQIKQGSAKICGNALEVSPILDFNAVKNFTGAELSSYISNCNTLKPGSYSICVQFFNLDRYPISKEMCKEFLVEDVVQVSQSYTSPQNISPADKKKFSDAEAKVPIIFRWTPLVPKPREPVTYRLKVWQLIQGQNASSAIRTSQPLVEKDVVNITQAVINNIYTGPCKLPYMCDYTWNVQALNRDGKPIGSNVGTSEAFNFEVKNSIVGETNTTLLPCTTPVISFPENGKAFNKDTKNIEIKGTINGESKSIKLQLFKISNDPNLVDDLRQKSKGASIFSPLEMFDYLGTAKKLNAFPKNYDVKTERSANNLTSFSAIIPTAELEHGSYYVVIQNGNCSSTPMAFSLSAGCGTNLSTVKMSCKGWVNGFPTYTVSIIFNNIQPLPGGQNCTTVMNSILPLTGSITGMATLPVTIPSGGSAPAVTFTYTPATATQTTVNFNYFGIWNDGFSNTSNFGSGAVILPSCVCNSCKDIQWNSGQSTATGQGSNFNILQPLNIVATGLGNIVSAKAEIIAFERYVGDSCVGCNKDYTQWGNFTSGTYAGNNGSLGNAVLPVSGNTTHSLYWNATGGGSLPASSSFNLNITTPMLSNLSCCCDKISVTIRYTFSFKMGNNGVCKMCSFIKRYEYKKGNCPNVVIDATTDATGNPSK